MDSVFWLVKGARGGKIGCIWLYLRRVWYCASRSFRRTMADLVIRKLCTRSSERLRHYLGWHRMRLMQMSSFGICYAQSRIVKREESTDDTNSDFEPIKARCFFIRERRVFSLSVAVRQKIERYRRHLFADKHAQSFSAVAQ